MGPRSARRARVALAVLGIAFSLLYARALGHGFVWDDVQEIQASPLFDQPLHVGLAATQQERMNPELGELSGVRVGHDSYRPLLFATYWLEIAAFGRNPTAMHATNLLLGLLAVWLAFAVARRWLDDPLAAVAATAVFALHPVQVESVAYISGRGDLLAGVLALAATWCFLRAREAGAGRDAGGPSWPGYAWLAASLAAYAGSLLSKESYLGLPVALAAIAWARGHARSSYRMLAAFPAVMLAYGLLRIAVAGGGGARHLDALLGLPGLVLRYAVIFALPFDLSIERLHQPGYLIPGWLAAIAVAALALVWKRTRDSRRARCMASGVAWAAALLAMSAIAVTITGVAADRYLYVPLLGFGVAAVAAVEKMLATPGARRIAITSAVAAWGIMCIVVVWMQVSVWRDNRALYAHAIAMEPESAMANYRYAYLFARARDWDQALPYLERAVALDPSNVRALNNLGVGYLEMGRFAEAKPVLRAVVEHSPGHYRGWYNLGLVNLRLGDQEQGCHALARALAIYPGYGAARALWAQTCA